MGLACHAKEGCVNHEGSGELWAALMPENDMDDL